MNAAALKTQYKFAKSTACIIIDTDAFQKSDLEKAAFKTDNPIEEMGIKQDVIAAPISQMVKDCLADTGMDNKSMLKCRNMFAVGLVCWLFSRDLTIAEEFIREKFAKKPEIAEANIKVIRAGYDYGHNTHASASHTYKIESKVKTPRTLYGHYGQQGHGLRLHSRCRESRPKALPGFLPHHPPQPMCCTNFPNTSHWA